MPADPRHLRKRPAVVLPSLLAACLLLAATPLVGQPDTPPAIPPQPRPPATATNATEATLPGLIAPPVPVRLVVTVHGLRNRNGTVRLALFAATDAEAFPTDLSRAARHDTAAIDETGRARFVLEPLARGRFALAAFHDENNNGELDTNFLGIPREGTGASRDARRRFGPPRFEDAALELAQPQIETTIRIRY